MHKQSGSLRVATIHGVPAFVHWSVLIAGIVPTAFTGFRPLESLYYCVAYVALIAAHELGHLLAARAFGLTVFAVDISGAGGKCRFQAPLAVRDTLFVFAAGLVAQGAIFACTLLYIAILGLPSTTFGKCLVNTFLIYNAVLAVINIIPHKISEELSTDGLVLWKLFRHKTAGEPHPLAHLSPKPKLLPPDTELLAHKEFVPLGFATGVQMLNDNLTPMEFVVGALEKHLKIDKESAIRAMLRTHWEGGVLLATDSFDVAERVATDISTEAAALGHPLQCKAVKTTVASANDA